MNLSFDTERRSTTLKAIAIGVLILVLLIPVGMIRGVVADRVQIEQTARNEIRNSWGGDQIIAGPILRIPYATNVVNSLGVDIKETSVAFMLAESVTMDSDVDVQTRGRGIHEVPVFAAEIDVRANFDLQSLKALGLTDESVDWDEVEVLLGVSDVAAINQHPTLSVGRNSAEFVAAKNQLPGMPPQLSVKSAELNQEWRESGEFTVQISLSVNGSRALEFLTLAEETIITTAANWPSPSFVGRRLPTEREITDTGFSATWQSTSLGRQIPAQWIAGEAQPNPAKDGLFGVRYIQPIGLYQLVTRALKYAVMFIGLTFVTYFLMETVGNARLHPMQYLLVGLANTLFYLLLLSLAEHTGFGIAYLLSAVASAGLIIGYSANVLVSRYRIPIMGGVLAGLYAFLYMTLRAEKFALLAGAIGLWVVLASVMYLTRRIDWYAGASAVVDKADQSEG